MAMLLIFFVSFISFITGLFLIFKPVLVIELQRRFYELINWRISPISMAKEIRNTRIMGGFLITIVIISGLYLLLK